MQGKTINGFTLQRPLGVGGMAEVWYAENEIGMKAAVKILSDELSRNAQMRERFLNEAKVMVQLDHPHIRKVYGYGSIDDRPAIIMEYLDGNDLKARLKHGQRFSDEELRRWWDQVVDALNYTHAQNIVHRDLKPSNLFLDQKGNVKLLDFGIAKVADTTSGTQTGSTLGTRIYMSPEQVKDPKRVGVKSDVYSLAVTFVHLLTGKAPYDSTTSSDYDIQVNIVTKPLDLEPLPAEWRNFLAPYLEKDPEKRPALMPFGAPAEANQPVPSEDDEKTEMTIQPEPEPQAQPRGRKSEPKAAKSVPSGIPSKETASKESAPKEVSPKKTTPKPIAEKPSGGGKSKKGILIGLAVAAAAIVLAVLLLKPKKEVVSLDTQAYNACQTVNDYRAYMDDYGRNAEHYADAKAFVDNYVAESLAKVELEKEEAAYQQCVTIASCDSYLNSYPQGRFVTEVKAKKAELEQQLAQQQAEAEAKSQAEAKAKAEAQAEADRKKEYDFYNKCATIADCDSYLKTYPKGRYVSEVKKKKAELEKAQQQAAAEAKAKAEAEKQEKAAYQNCTTIAACDSYLKTYPQGRYVSEVKKKKADLEKAQQSKPSQNLTGSANGHEWVDLGLPSGTLWATCNVGASKPEDYGNHYAWGETNTKSDCFWRTYRYANGNEKTLTKYCNKSDYGYNGFTDNLTTLQSGDDPATVIWGNGWCTPTKAQWDELESNTTHKQTMKNGVNGLLLTSKKNGQTIFLSAPSSYGYYNSSSLYINDPRYVWIFGISYGSCHTFTSTRDGCQSVRPVRSTR